MNMKRIMATATSASKGQIKPSPSPGRSKAPSLSPSPTLHKPRRAGGGNTNNNNSARNGHGSDSDSAITAGMRDLNLRQRGSAPKQFDNRRTFSSNASQKIIRNLGDVANMLKDNHAKNIVIVAGAGISTPSGIPDFRTPGTGLYDNLQQYNVPYPEAIFDIDFFHHNPRPFFALAKELYPSGKYRPNYIHYFARLLNDRGLLLRMYTQNIDGLERLAGVPPDKMVEAHGTFSSASCVICQERYRGAEIKENIFEEKLPKCRKRGCPGLIKPDIVFFGEELPKRFYFYLKDMLQTDLVLVMGTSLEVQPFAGIIDTVRWTVPRVLFNRDPVGPFKNGKRAKDFVSQGDLIDRLQVFADAAGMKDEMVDLITQCEGTFRLAAPPPPEPRKPRPPPPSDHRTNPVLAAMWRQNAKINMYDDSSSSESSDYDDSESDSSSSGNGGKKPVKNNRLPVSNRTRGANMPPNKPPNKPRNARIHTSVNSNNNNAINTRRPISGRPPSGKPASNTNNKSGPSGINSARNYSSSSSSSLLSKRKDPSPSGKPPHPHSARAIGNSPSRTQNICNKENGSWTNNSVRRKIPIDVGLRPDRKPPQAPGTHATKPRSSSVNKATPESMRTKTGGGGFRSVMDRVRSAKPAPRITYQNKAAAKPAVVEAYDARSLAFNASNSSSDDDDDDDDDDGAGDSSSDDSR